MNILIIITDKYPYGSSETFVYNEIPFAEQAFDKVFLLPVHGEKDSYSHRQPASAIVIEREVDEKITRASQICALNKRSITECFRQIGQKQLFQKISSILYNEAVAGTTKQSLLSLLSAIRALSPDRIVVYSYWFSAHALAAIDMARLVKTICPLVTCVSRAHGYDLYEERNELCFLPYQKYMLEHIDKVFVCSKEGSQYLTNKYPRFASRITTSYLGVTDSWNGQYPGRKKSFHIYSCSNVIPVKRIDLMIRALASLKDDDITWTHLGDGCQLDEMKLLAKQLLPENIHVNFLGRIDNNAVKSLLNQNAFNLILNTSSSEGLPVSLMEAFSCGIPAVAPAVGGISEIVDDGCNGMLFPEDATPEAIADKIISFVRQDAETYQRFCMQARIKYETSFKADVNYHSFFHNLKGSIAG